MIMHSSAVFNVAKLKQLINARCSYKVLFLLSWVLQYFCFTWLCVFVYQSFQAVLSTENYMHRMPQWTVFINLQPFNNSVYMDIYHRWRPSVYNYTYVCVECMCGVKSHSCTIHRYLLFPLCKTSMQCSPGCINI